MPILAKKIIFSDEAHFDLGGCVNKQNCLIWGTENLHAYIEKPTHPKRVTVSSGFRSRGAIFLRKWAKKRPLQSMPIVIRPCWTNFCSQKWKSRILATFGFNSTALRATQPKLHWIYFIAPCVCRIAEATLDVLRSVFEDRRSRRGLVDSVLAY